MDSFEDWVKTANAQCFQEYGERAVELGASWDTFRRDDLDSIVDDLVGGGIPILAARDMATLAAAEVAKAKSPMAVFWDLENMPIPTDTSGRDITTSLKSILAPHGDLIQFRGYASIGLNNIPQEKRSDLQLSGCHLVDCPHQGRKEVADKMIIVDAMHFAFQHMESATLCFITGDVDYAYLLATLQRPQWRTIVISRGTMQSMLEVNCTMKMRWETDILQPIYRSASPREELPSDFVSAQSETSRPNAWDRPFRPLSADEGWKDDVELLRAVLKQASRQCGSLAPLKSVIGQNLRNTNPARFPQRLSIQLFLSRAIEEGIVVENGEGGMKTLCLPAHAGYASTVPALTLSKSLPNSFEGGFPPKVASMALSLRFVVVLKKMYCPSGASPPAKALIQSSDLWLFYLFSSQKEAVDAATENSWLRQGTLFDFNEHRSPGGSNGGSAGQVYPPTKQNALFCLSCGAQIIFEDDASQPLWDSVGCVYCSKECKEWIDTSSDQKEKGIVRVVEALQFLAEYDDLYSPMSMLGKLISQRNPELCSYKSRLPKLFMLEAEKAGRVVLYTGRNAGNKKTSKCICLPEFYRESYLGETPPDTTAEEKFVHDMLWDEAENGVTCICRKEINRRLKEAFPSMSDRQRRHQVFVNAKAKELFFVAKGAKGQIVGLSKEDAEAALEGESLAVPVPSVTSESAVQETHEADDDDSDDELDLAKFVKGRK